MLAHPRRDAGELGVGELGIVLRRLDDDMAVGVGERGEIALGIDHDLLHQAGALLQQAAQQVRLAGAGVALDEEAGGQQLH